MSRPRGERVLELIEVMDRLRSPGGCPWDAEQTHDSLVPYLVEEAYELVEAIESGDLDHVVEELGDVLLQVVFHARVGQENPNQPFDIDDVAGCIAEKLRRRHPHVFGDASVDSAAEVSTRWEEIKAAEKPERSGPLAGVPEALPALERAQKVVSRLDRAGMLGVLRGLPASRGDDAVAATQASAKPGSDLGERILALVVEGHDAGLDASAELRKTLRQLELRLREG